VESTKPIKLMFLSDKKDSSGAATCTIMCADTATAPPPTTTTAILVTGGQTTGVTISKSVEVLKEDGTPLCMLPDMPDIKMDHTQSGLLACGSSVYSMSSSNTQTCISFSSGVWSETYTLINRRRWHVSWSSPIGIILMGGSSDDGVSSTTELLTNNGVSQNHFQLKYPLNEACAIELDDKVIVTGGVKNSLTVSVYNTAGWVEDLPNMQQGRFDHGCGHFINSNNEMVYLVAGGSLGGDPESTEILVSGSSAWSLVGNLPGFGLFDLRGVSFNNKVIMTGGLLNTAQKYILSFNIATNTWEEMGELQVPRYGHGMSVVPFSDISNYCT